MTASVRRSKRHWLPLVRDRLRLIVCRQEGGAAYIPIGPNMIAPPRNDWAAMEAWLEKPSWT